jgi:hypothetical protein
VLRPAALALGTAVVLLAGPAGAHSNLAYQIVVENGAVQDERAGGGTVGPLADELAVADVGRSAAGAVTVLNHGHLALTADASAAGQAETGGPVTMQSNAIASFGDDVTIHPPGPSLFAQPGTLVARVELAGHGSVFAGAGVTFASRASYTLGLDFSSCLPCAFDRYGEWYDFGDGSIGFVGDLPAALVTTPVPFTFGAPFHLDVSLSLFAQAAAAEEPVVSEASVDFGGSVRWGGILEVRDGKGDLVSGFSVSSASGTDYAQPVPEPDAGLLAPAALALVATLARRYGRITASVQASRSMIRRATRSTSSLPSAATFSA